MSLALSLLLAASADSSVIDKHRSISFTTTRGVSALGGYSMVQQYEIQLNKVWLLGANSRNKWLTAGATPLCQIASRK